MYHGSILLFANLEDCQNNASKNYQGQIDTQ